ncbi:hypothetical protein FIBSPDRAFT_1037366 [Athelia psychrophila]|uniref:Tautomerase cis-CaaD-like domain-containing protein n=1 Tax=Athelia psychrophila TaxID=1759441 RepID=A0A166ULS4_9AGAM|nr:hypothetical protein FIBSPDRAFT_1037366 [Fibularhizoctonia sp. CBS 109695]
MPLRRLFVPPTLYSDQDRKDIAAATLSVYTAIPPFYVLVPFVDVPVTYCETTKRAFMDLYEAAIAPWTKGRGIDWKVQITEDDRTLWNENGMNPPLPGTSDEELWRIQNKAVPYGSYIL